MTSKQHLVTMTIGVSLVKMNQGTVSTLITFLVWIVFFHSTNCNAFIFGVQALQSPTTLNKIDFFSFRLSWRKEIPMLSTKCLKSTKKIVWFILSQMTALISFSFLSQMTSLQSQLQVSCSLMSQRMQRVPLLDSELILTLTRSVWMTYQLLMSPQQLQQQLQQWLKSPQQEVQQQTCQNISSTNAKQLEFNTRQKAQAFCIPLRKQLTMQLQISCCFLFKTIQQLRYQVFCHLVTSHDQQLQQQWMAPLT